MSNQYFIRKRRRGYCDMWLYRFPVSRWTFDEARAKPFSEEVAKRLVEFHQKLYAYYGDPDSPVEISAVQSKLTGAGVPP